MPILGLLGGLFSMIGSGVQAVFGFKSEQAAAVKEAIKMVGDYSASEGQREAAVATIIAAENGSGYAISAIWRPLMMLIFLGFLVSFWLGYVPVNATGPMPPMITEIFELIKIGMGGYIGGRSLEKIVSSLSLGPVLKQFISKKLL
jgi:hypothetical protein